MGMQHKKHPWFIPEWLIGVKALGYRLEKVLGSGGFGAVYQTTTPNGQERAVKVLYPPHSRNAEDMRKWRNCASHFLREITTTAHFNHPNIIRIYDSGMLQWRYEAPEGLSEPGGDYLLPFYIADYIPDGVEQRLTNAKTLTAGEVTEIARGILEGLTALHSFNPPVLHLDLNPANIRLAEGRRAVLTDFGVACIMGGELKLDITTGQPEPPAIHPGVAAPEQYTWEEPDRRADIYQFGALCFKMLTGKYPRDMSGMFPGRTEVLAELNKKDVPNNLADTICRCLEIRRENRFPHVKSLKAALAKRRLPLSNLPPVWRKLVPLLLGASFLGVIIWLVITPPTHPLPGLSIKISIASAVTKKEWLEQAIRDFNIASVTDSSLQVDGKTIFVEAVLEEGEYWRSGSMVKDILFSKITPTIASPSDDFWLAKLNQDWAEAHNGRPVASGPSPSVARTPVVIAMWKSRAQAMGVWPDAGPNATWDSIRALATNPDGWAMYGMKGWGAFKFGYGYVGESNSGTVTAVMLYMLGEGKFGDDLKLDDVQADRLGGKMLADVEKAKVHSGMKSQWLLDRMESGGPEYLDAIATEEQNVIIANRDRRGLQEAIVAIYPRDGTVMNTHPFAILDGAPWVTAEQRKASGIFLQFLLSPGQQDKLLDSAMRPADPTATLRFPIDADHGANPGARIVPLKMPAPVVFDQIIKVWHQVKKPAHIVVLSDKSSSMAGEKMTTALGGAKAFVNAMDPKDWLAWVTFDDRVYIRPQGFKRDVNDQLMRDISSTTAGGGNALYDAMYQVLDMLEKQPDQRPKLGGSVRYGIVVLSDGRDTSSKTSLDRLVDRLKGSRGDPTGIQIHTIGIGVDADEAALRSIADVGNGRYWKVQKAKELEEVYKAIATYY